MGTVVTRKSQRMPACRPKYDETEDLLQQARELREVADQLIKKSDRLIEAEVLKPQRPSTATFSVLYSFFNSVRPVGRVYEGPVNRT